MNDGFSGTPDDFATAHGHVKDAKDEMDGHLAKLRSDIEATRAGWDGPAATVFNQVMHAFDDKAKKLNEALEHIGQLLKDSGVQYEAQESDTHGQLSQLQSALEGL